MEIAYPKISKVYMLHCRKASAILFVDKYLFTHLKSGPHAQFYNIFSQTDWSHHPFRRHEKLANKTIKIDKKKYKNLIGAPWKLKLQIDAVSCQNLHTNNSLKNLKKII